MLQTYLERMNSAGWQHLLFLLLLLLLLFFPYFILLSEPFHYVLAVSDVEAAISSNDTADTRAFELSPEARAQADLKFTYVLTCQIYGKQKEGQKPEAADIALLMQR